MATKVPFQWPCGVVLSTSRSLQGTRPRLTQLLLAAKPRLANGAGLSPDLKGLVLVVCKGDSFQSLLERAAYPIALLRRWAWRGREMIFTGLSVARLAHERKTSTIEKHSDRSVRASASTGLP